MLVNRFEDEATWKAFRIGRITGTRLADITPKKTGSGKKVGFWQVIAERLSIDDGYEDMMERGKELEKEAITKFTEETGIKVDDGLVIWTREDNDSIAISPDAYSTDLKVAVECKCLNSAAHIEAAVTNKIPPTYSDQILQYFVVSDELETLYFVMYDPRLVNKQYLQFEVKREEVQEKVTEYLEMEKNVLQEIEDIVNELSGF